MVELIWEFTVKDKTYGQFELVFGPGGEWGNLFKACGGFRGATILRDMKKQERYLLVEVWDSEDQRNASLEENETQYDTLKATLSQFSESMTEIGLFQVLPQAGVKPLRKTRRSRWV
jgi:heme-degrading monooxygenase HmoA